MPLRSGPAANGGDVRVPWIQLGVVVAVLALSIRLLVTVGSVAPLPLYVKHELIASILEQEATRLDAATRKQLARTLIASERELGVDALLILAVIERESRYDPAAVGPRGGLGLMQLRLRTAWAVARELDLDLEGRAELFEPLVNVRLGSAYLAEMKERFGEWEAALTAYNMGPTRLRGAMSRGFEPPSRYARRVLRRFGELERRHAGLVGDGPLADAREASAEKSR